VTIQRLDDHGTPVPGGQPALLPGRSVEVWCRSNQNWARGFVVVSVTDGGASIRRVSDGAVLPVLFDPVDVRAADPAAPVLPPRRRSR
jgi:hypothetical protein